MNPSKLDHVAIWISDRDAVASALCNELSVQIIERSDKFTLIGPSATSGKITLFDPPGHAKPRAARLVSITLACDRAREPFAASDELLISFVENRDVELHSVVGLTMRCADPTVAAAEYVASFGFTAQSAHPDVATVTLGDASMTLVREAIQDVDQPVLNHLGLLVESADESIASAHELGLIVERVVDAANTKAVFLAGPEAVLIEYVEHKPQFALRG